MLEFFLVLSKISQQKSHQYNPEILFFQSIPRNQKRLQKLTSYRIFKMRYFCQILGNCAQWRECLLKMARPKQIHVEHEILFIFLILVHVNARVISFINSPYLYSGIMVKCINLLYIHGRRVVIV